MMSYPRSVLGILFTFWVMGFLIYEQKGSFFLPRGTGIKYLPCVLGFWIILLQQVSLLLSS